MISRTHRPISAYLALVLPLFLACCSGASAAPTSITEFTAGLNPGAQPEAMVAGPDGNLWFVDRNQFIPKPPAPQAIGRITPEGEITEFSQGISGGRLVDISAGPDGNIWFTDAGTFGASPAIGRITPSGVITMFTAGLLSGTKPRRIIAGADGNLWFSATGSSSGIGKVTPAGSITEFALPRQPRSLVVGPDGNIWFTCEGPSPGIGRVVRNEDGTTTITLFAAGLQPDSDPQDIIVGPDGNLWFSDPGETTPAIGRITTSGKITEFSQGLAAESEPGELLVGPKGDIWFADWKSAIGKITVEGQITEYETPTETISTPLDIAFGPEGDLWYTDYNRPSIGRVTPTGQITEFWSGLQISRPNAIVLGDDDNLWFTDDNAPLIGRIVAGDDSPPNVVTDPPQQRVQPQFPNRRATLLLQRRRIRVRDTKAILHLRCLASSRCEGQLAATAQLPSRRGGRTVNANRLVFRAVYSIAQGDTAMIKSMPLRPGALRRLHSAREPLKGQLSARERTPFPSISWQQGVQILLLQDVRRGSD